MLDRILIGSSVEPTDPNFKNVTLLLHGDGSNGAQNNTFLDSSTNNFTITRNGNTTQGSFSPYGSNWSNYFDGTGDYLTVPANTAFAFGTGDFTVEFWFNAASYRTSGPYYDCFLALGNFANSPYFRINQDGRLTAGITASNEYYSTSTVTLNQWTHFAVTRQGSTVRIFVNGSLQTTQTNSTNLLNSTDVTIGTSAWQAANETFTGYLSNIRVLKGTALYTSTFTPSTTPLTAITNTSLLTCQSNRFRDASTNNFTITRNGDVKVTNFAPFAPSSSYSTSTNGGSAYFDGSGDYLTLGSNAAYAPGSGDFTWECWVYPTATPGVFWITDTSGGLQIGFQDASTWGVARAVIQWYMTSTTLPTNFMWNHIAVTRSGSNMALFLNGTRIATKTSATADFSTGSTAIMANLSGVSATAGYTTDIRLVKGTAIYDPTVSTYTVPTAPLTAVTNTGFLAKCQNAAIFDNSMKNDLETVGNAQISTSVKKFGTGSMAFDGSGDALTAASSPALPLGSGNFTVECWFYATATMNYAAMWSTDDGTNSGSGIRLVTGPNNNNLTVGIAGSAVLTASSAYTDNTWNHAALVRNNGTITIYLNGTSVGSFSNTTDFSLQTFFVGRYGAAYYWTGYIDDLRITKGVARYTANFTAPTAPFPNK
jgi:hypothetical protein